MQIVCFPIAFHPVGYFFKSELVIFIVACSLLVVSGPSFCFFKTIKQSYFIYLNALLWGGLVLLPVVSDASHSWCHVSLFVFMSFDYELAFH